MGAVLRIANGIPTKLASPAQAANCDSAECLQTLPNVLQEAKSQLRTSAFITRSAQHSARHHNAAGQIRIVSLTGVSLNPGTSDYQVALAKTLSQISLCFLICKWVSYWLHPVCRQSN